MTCMSPYDVSRRLHNVLNCCKSYTNFLGIFQTSTYMDLEGSKLIRILTWNVPDMCMYRPGMFQTYTYIGLGNLEYTFGLVHSNKAGRLHCTCTLGRSLFPKSTLSSVPPCKKFPKK